MLRKITSRISIFWLLFFVIVASVFHLYLSSGFPDTHDGNNHLVRFANYKIAIKEGQFPPRWAPNLLNQYGYPVFNFNYPLANILSLPFSILKINYELTFKILIFLSIVFGGIGLRKWLEIVGIKNEAIYWAIISWLSFPYIISAVYFRGNIGEIIAYCLIPFVLYSLEKLKVNQLYSFEFALHSLVLSAFFLSHNVTAVFFLPILIVYCIFSYRTQYQAWLRLLLLLLVSIASTLWFWLPALSEMSQTTVTETGLTKNYFQHFVTLDQLFLSPQLFGYSVPGSVDGLSFNIGLLSFFVVITSILMVSISYIKEKQISYKAQVLGFSTFIIILLAFFQIEGSSRIWQIFNFTQVIQFPWRLSIYIAPFLALSVSILLQQSKFIRYVIYILIFVQVFSGWRAEPVATFHRTREEYDTQTISTSILDENKPKTFQYDYKDPWEPVPKIISGAAQVQVVSWNGSKHIYEINVEDEAVVIEPTANFSGWETYADNETQKSKLEYIDDSQIKGRIAYSISPGKYLISTTFTQNTKSRVIGNTVSLITLLILVLYAFSNKKIV